MATLLAEQSVLSGELLQTFGERAPATTARTGFSAKISATPCALWLKSCDDPQQQTHEELLRGLSGGRSVELPRQLHRARSATCSR
jgi:hypothetical protein